MPALRNLVKTSYESARCASRSSLTHGLRYATVSINARCYDGMICAPRGPLIPFARAPVPMFPLFPRYILSYLYSLLHPGPTSLIFPQV